MPRVLHVLAPGPLGGLERVVQTLAAAQRSTGDLEDVRVLTLVGSIGESEDFAAPLRQDGVPVDTIVTPPRAYRRERAAITAYCRAHRPGVLHSHGAHADVLTAGVARTVGAASVSTMHGLVDGDWRNRGYEWLQRLSCRRRDAVVAVARPLAKRLIAGGLPPERMHVVRNAWRPTAAAYSRTEARRRLGLAPEDLVIGWVGRISPEKGLDVLLAALAAPALRGCHACVIGDGASRAALERQQTHGGPHQGCTVSWHGHLPEASRYLTAFDVLVVSSRTEGSPMVLLEAMAAHVPVVATRVGGIPDILGESDGLLVPSEDPQALAAAIAAVLTHPDAAARRATGANVRLQLEFGVPRWTDRYRYIYMVARDAAGLHP
jgi:glycosyltransferase involved in cell wall biosynthesis